MAKRKQAKPPPERLDIMLKVVFVGDECKVGHVVMPHLSPAKMMTLGNHFVKLGHCLLTREEMQEEVDVVGKDLHALMFGGWL